MCDDENEAQAQRVQAIVKGRHCRVHHLKDTSHQILLSETSLLYTG